MLYSPPCCSNFKFFEKLIVLILQLITANQEDFVNLINAPDDGAAAPAATPGTDGNPNLRQHV